MDLKKMFTQASFLNVPRETTGNNKPAGTVDLQGIPDPASDLLALLLIGDFIQARPAKREDYRALRGARRILVVY